MIEKVEKLFKDCLYKEEDLENEKPKNKPIKVEGICMNVWFNPVYVEKNKNEINKLVNNLHPNFKEGWSFVNLNLDKKSNQWTGNHRTMELLLLLGLATGKMEYCCSREMWSFLPLKLPYVRIK